MNIHYYSSSSQSTITYVDLSGDENTDEALFTLWPSPLDYVPFYKSRTFTGDIYCELADKSFMTGSYRVTITCTGLCSGHSFRELARTEILRSIKNQSNPKNAH